MLALPLALALLAAPGPDRWGGDERVLHPASPRLVRADAILDETLPPLGAWELEPDGSVPPDEEREGWDVPSRERELFREGWLPEEDDREE